jgi:transcriptional regulator with XRE-family HTH domain
MATFKPPKKAARPDLQSMMLAIHKAMHERKLDVKGLCKALGVPIDKRPAVYNWTTGKNGPGPEYRAKLAQVLGLTEAQLTAPGSKSKQLLGPAQRAVALVAAQPVAVTLTAEPVRDVFSIVGRSDGQISVRLQATLDAQRGMALARFLMDFGLIVGSDAFGEDHDESE